VRDGSKAIVEAHDTARLRQTAQGVFSPAEVRDVLRSLHRAAMWEDPNTGKHDIKAKELFLAYTVGSPRAPLTGILDADVTKLDTREACLEAASEIMRGELSGLLSRDEAHALRESVKLALAALGGDAAEERPPEINVHVQAYKHPKGESDE